MYKIPIVAGLAVMIGACSATLGCPTGQTAVSIGATGELVYMKVMGECPPPIMGPNRSGVFADGPLPAPAPGQAWWDI